jgi:hypothetical protein
MRAILEGNEALALSFVRRQLRENVFPSAGFFWWRHYLPKHFTEEAYTRYGYTRRDRKYVTRKLKAFGNMEPLVFRGKARSAATKARPRIRTVTTPGRQSVTVVIDIPNYLKLNKRYGYPLSQEVVRHNTEEDSILFQVMKRGIDHHILGKAVALPQAA